MAFSNSASPALASSSSQPTTYTSANASGIKFSLTNSEATHTYQPVSSYLCTVSPACFDLCESDESQTAQESILINDQIGARLVTAQHLFLNSNSVLFICNLIHESKSHFLQTLQGNSAQQENVNNETMLVDESDDGQRQSADDEQRMTQGSNLLRKKDGECWTRCGGIVLTKKDLQLITSGRELSDMHVNAYQNLMRKQFPHIGGFKNTLLELKSPLPHHKESGSKSLQIIHTRNSHWASLQISGTDIFLYDSAYSSASVDTLEVVAQLVRSSKKAIEIQVMNVAKQSGSVDCALFAMATITCLALDIDPLCVVFDQEQLRPHLVKSLETGAISSFPILKKRRPATRVSKVETCSIYCYCRLPDNGEKMVCCDNCEEWFHVRCINTKVSTNLQDCWYCNNCKIN